jgi:transposase
MQKMCGVDISKDWLDSFVAPDHFQRFANDGEGIAALADFVSRHEADLVVMESSGGIERLPFTLLWERSVACAIVNPRNVRDFARATGHLEKTDRIDAQVIAHYAHVRQIQPTPPPSQNQQRLSALAARMQQVVSDLTINKQRLHSTFDEMARQGIQELIALLKRQSKTLGEAIASLIDADPLWAALNATLRSVKGVADRTVAILMADLPELGTLSNKAISKLAGLAPLADDSGRRQGTRRTRGGRASVRSILFLVADIVAKFDPSMKAFKQRLIEKGKPKMVVRIALAHKLIVRLNAKARETRQIFVSPA